MTAVSREPAGIPAGGQFATHDRAEPTAELEAASRTEQVLTLLRSGTVGTYDAMHDTVLLHPRELNLPVAPYGTLVDQISESVATIDLWNLPVEDVLTAQLRIADDPLRVDALDWYIDTAGDDEHFDDQASFHGAQGPLAAKVGDEYWLIDGNHRAARAIITGAPTFRLQAFEVHADW